MKHCKICKKDLPISAFGKLHSSKDKLNYYCKSCNSARGLKRYYAKKDQILANIHKDRKENYEHRIEIERKSRAKNKEKWRLSRNARQSIRNRIINSDVYIILEKDLRRIYSSPCINCGSKENQSLDHIIPLSRGGTHSIGNITTLCLTCNMKKHNRFFSEWRYSKSHTLQD